MDAAGARDAGEGADARDAIEQEKNDRLKAIEDERAGAGAAHQQALDDAKARLAAAVAKAQPYQQMGPVFQKTPAIATPFQTLAHGDAAGTFSAAAAGRMGFGHTLAERTAHATEQTVEQLKELNGKGATAFA